MASPPPASSKITCALILAAAAAVASLHLAAGGAPFSSFYRDFDLTWGGDRGKVLSNGELLSLSLDRNSGSGIVSKKEYLFGRIDMQLKLVPGNSAGTVTSLYLASEGDARDEIDYEFLGNVSGQPYTIHTNVYTGGKGDREQQFRMWFDPTKEFHTYSILWNLHHISFLVDGTPIRDFGNHERRGVPFPRRKPMKLFSSIWNADDWATRGGIIKTDWSQAPFVAFCRGFRASSSWRKQGLDIAGRRRMRMVRQRYMIYDYCTDRKRFPNGSPRECLSDK